VVAPTVALRQWSEEMSNHVAEEGKLSIYFFHGQKRVNEESELLKYDIVVTSYAVIESAFRKQQYGFRRKNGLYKEPSALHQIQWERIVLDECHAIKDRSTNTARAVFGLQGHYKWALSGTPVQNRVGELYSVIRFLQLDPFAYYFCRECPCKSLNWKFSDHSKCDDCGHRVMVRGVLAFDFNDHHRMHHFYRTLLANIWLFSTATLLLLELHYFKANSI
jgi:DNA repair protein RAD16